MLKGTKYTFVPELHALQFVTRQTLDFTNVRWRSGLHALQSVNWPTLSVTKYTRLLHYIIYSP
jgi:hypothetical protein